MTAHFPGTVLRSGGTGKDVRKGKTGGGLALRLPVNVSKGGPWTKQEKATKGIKEKKITLGNGNEG